MAAHSRIKSEAAPVDISGDAIGTGSARSDLPTCRAHVIAESQSRLLRMLARAVVDQLRSEAHPIDDSQHVR